MSWLDDREALNKRSRQRRHIQKLSERAIRNTSTAQQVQTLLPPERMSPEVPVDSVRIDFGEPAFNIMEVGSRPGLRVMGDTFKPQDRL